MEKGNFIRREDISIIEAYRKNWDGERLVPDPILYAKTRAMGLAFLLEEDIPKKDRGGKGIIFNFPL